MTSPTISKATKTCFRGSALLAAICLSACGVGSTPDSESTAQEELAALPDPAKTAPEAKRDDVLRDDGKLSCALAGSERFTRTCSLERISNDEGKQMIFRHPDGGFRRFLVVTDGRGLVAADGADDAVVKVLDDKVIEVSVNGDRYQLPAKIEG